MTDRISIPALREEIEKVKRDLWVHDPPVALPPKQATGWNNALVAFERRLLARFDFGEGE